MKGWTQLTTEVLEDLYETKVINQITYDIVSSNMKVGVTYSVSDKGIVMRHEEVPEFVKIMEMIKNKTYKSKLIDYDYDEMGNKK